MVISNSNFPQTSIIPQFGPRYNGPFASAGFIDPYEISFTYALTIEIWKLKEERWGPSEFAYKRVSRWSPRERMMASLNYKAIRFMSTWDCDQENFKPRSQIISINCEEYEIVLGNYEISIKRKDDRPDTCFVLIIPENTFSFFNTWLKKVVVQIEDYLQCNDMVDVLPFDPQERKERNPFEKSELIYLFENLNIQ